MTAGRRRPRRVIVARPAVNPSAKVVPTEHVARCKECPQHRHESGPSIILHQAGKEAGGGGGGQDAGQPDPEHGHDPGGEK